MRNSFAPRLEKRVKAGIHLTPALGLPRDSSRIFHARRTEAGFSFQLSVRQSSLVWQHSRSTNATRLVALAIADFADDNGRAYPSIKTLAKKAAISERATHYALCDLEGLGELTRTMNAGPRGVNVYQLTVREQGVQNLQGGCKVCSGGVQNATERGAKSAPKPSGTVIEPSEREKNSRSFDAASPSEEEFVAECKRLKVPVRFAREKFHWQDAKGWPENWRAVAQRVKLWSDQQNGRQGEFSATPTKLPEPPPLSPEELAEAEKFQQDAKRRGIKLNQGAHSAEAST